MVPDESVVRVGGPWRHRAVSAGGVVFHTVEAGAGPLVLLLHGFPEFWWSWQHQLRTLPADGFRAVAVDLRGYGGSDKPPRGYDLPTLATDVAGLIRALGEAEATVVGHDWGGLLAWTAGVYHPKLVRSIATVSIPHPLRLRAAVATDLFGQAWRSRYGLGFQLPILPERQLVKDDAALVSRILRAWRGKRDWPNEQTERLCRDAIRIPGVAHSALEYHRWLLRALPRPDGLRYVKRMRTPLRVPTLQIHGDLDGCVLPRSAHGSGRYVAGPYQWRTIEGTGHFPHEEAPAAFDAELRAWLLDTGTRTGQRAR